LAYLVIASLIWAFSFGLIKDQLEAYDPLAVTFARLAISALVFLPFLRPARAGRATIVRAAALGVVQFGLMYWLYTAAYGFLPAYGVALFTIFTPVYVVLIEGVWSRRLVWHHIAGAGLAITGAATIVWRTFDGAGAVLGIGLLQASNLCFAIGQVVFRRWVRRRAARVPEVSLVAWMYVGAAIATGLFAVLFVDTPRADFGPGALWVLLYLGVAPTAVGFYLWNKGAVRVGPGVLAAANNLKVPLAVAVSWLVFGESAPYLRVLVGLGVIVAGLALTAARDARERSESAGQKRALFG
jgi:drug/metabolite transporter (DMT)-like permease